MANGDAALGGQPGTRTFEVRLRPLSSLSRARALSDDDDELSRSRSYVRVCACAYIYTRSYREGEGTIRLTRSHSRGIHTYRILYSSLCLSATLLFFFYVSPPLQIVWVYVYTVSRSATTTTLVQEGNNSVSLYLSRATVLLSRLRTDTHFITLYTRCSQVYVAAQRTKPRARTAARTTLSRRRGTRSLTHSGLAGWLPAPAAAANSRSRRCCCCSATAAVLSLLSRNSPPPLVA